MSGIALVTRLARATGALIHARSSPSRDRCPVASVGRIGAGGDAARDVRIASAIRGRQRVIVSGAGLLALDAAAVGGLLPLQRRGRAAA
jgi:hypothetical protein